MTLAHDLVQEQEPPHNLALPNAGETGAKARGYWQVYHDEATLARFDALHRDAWIISTDVRIHIDVYERPEPDAPVFIFNHGGGGYSRLFIPLALAMYDRGYTVLLPDQRGQGLSEGDRGDFTIPQLVNNVRDVAIWARERYAGPIFMAGGSMGSGLVYSAAAAGAPVEAIVCHNLYSFGNATDSIALSRFAFWGNVAGGPKLISGLTGVAARMMPGLKLPFRLFGRFHKMVDKRDRGFFGLWKRDPLPIKRISLRYLRSTFTTPSAVSFGRNTLPILVINPMRDEMVHPMVTRRNFLALGGPKHYVEISYGHWATNPTFVAEWTELVDSFLQRHR